MWISCGSLLKGSVGLELGPEFLTSSQVMLLVCRAQVSSVWMQPQTRIDPFLPLWVSLQSNMDAKVDILI